MKKIVIIIIGMLLLTSCGVGAYSISSGMADESKISFVSADKTPISVTIDNETFSVNTVKTAAWRTERRIKDTAQNTIKLAPGQHNVVVSINGKEVYNKKLFFSTQEHKVIEL